MRRRSLAPGAADPALTPAMTETLLVSPERSAREASALAEIVQRINQSLELDRVFSLIVRHAAELLHARGARLGLVEDGKDDVHHDRESKPRFLRIEKSRSPRVSQPLGFPRFTRHENPGHRGRRVHRLACR